MKLQIPEEEISWTFSRSGGSGGQNVNKVSSKVTLHWDPAQSRALSDYQRARVLASAHIRRLMNAAGEIVIYEQRDRSQTMNRARAIEKLVDLLALALRPIKKRVKTRAPRSVKENRLEGKRRQSQRKGLRKWSGKD